MKKSLAVLLLLLLVVGCGESKQASESSPQQPPAPTLADSFQGKRIHFQFFGTPDQRGIIPDKEEEVWLQLGDNNQVTVCGMFKSMSYAINETKLIVDTGGKLFEIRFSKPDLAVGDQVIFFAHADGNLQALLDSTDDSEHSATGSITKIEAAREIDSNDTGSEQPGTEPTAVPNKHQQPATARSQTAPARNTPPPQPIPAIAKPAPATPDSTPPEDE